MSAGDGASFWEGQFLDEFELERMEGYLGHVVEEVPCMHVVCCAMVDCVLDLREGYAGDGVVDVVVVGLEVEGSDDCRLEVIAGLRDAGLWIPF